MGFHIKLFQQNAPKCLSGATSIFFITPESGLILSECSGALTPAGQLTGHSVRSHVRSSRETAPHNRCEVGSDSAANALSERESLRQRVSGWKQVQDAPGSSMQDFVHHVCARLIAQVPFSRVTDRLTCFPKKKIQIIEGQEGTKSINATHIFQAPRCFLVAINVEMRAVGSVAVGRSLGGHSNGNNVLWTDLCCLDLSFVQLASLEQQSSWEPMEIEL